MTRLISLLAALSICGITFAQDTTNCEAKADCAFQLDLSETVSFYSFDTNIVAVNTHVAFEATDWLEVSADLPIFNNEVGTGLGDVTVAGTVGLIDSKCDFLGADKATLDAFVAFGIPLDGEFSSSRSTAEEATAARDSPRGAALEAASAATSRARARRAPRTEGDDVDGSPAPH